MSWQAGMLAAGLLLGAWILYSVLTERASERSEALRLLFLFVGIGVTSLVLAASSFLSSVVHY